jgi:hypothetical protein
MSLEELQEDLEQIDGIELATTEEDDDWKGTVLYLTLEEAHEGEAESVLDRALSEVSRDYLTTDFDPDERVDTYRDAIEIRL